MEADAATLFAMQDDERINGWTRKTTTAGQQQWSSLRTLVRRSWACAPLLQPRDASKCRRKLPRVMSCCSLHRHVSHHFLFVLFLLGVSRTSAAAGDVLPQVKGIAGEDVEIPCILNSRDTDCGNVHSVKWYEDGDRVYVYYSADQDHNKPEGRLLPDRAVFMANSTPPSLRINSVQLLDEGAYRCDVTYESLKSGCSTGSTVDLKTIAKPNSPEIFLDDLNDDSRDGIVTSTRITPFHEGERIELICEASGGKPAARVTWWNGTQSLGGVFTEDAAADDGTGTGRNTIQLHVTRSDLMARYDCQVTHEALEEPLFSYIEMDVYVAPLSLELKVESKSEVFDGETVSLSCLALHANPAATITWFNGSEPVENQPSEDERAEEDGTSTSYSKLTFTAGRFDDGEDFSCQATNKATAKRPLEALSRSVTVVVYYSPVVRLLPDVPELQLNESDTLRLDCVFEANPANISEIIWLRNGEPYQPDGDGVVVSRDNNVRDDASAAVGYEDGVGTTAVSKEEGSFQLVVERVSRRDAGQFQCSVSNVAGLGRSANTVNVTVSYPPEVRIILFPSSFAVEHVTNVTLTCEIEDAFPEEVTSVLWLRDGKLFNETAETVLVLTQANRSLHGNYSCRAKNSVGWGNASESLLLNILYTPGQAAIEYNPRLVVKGEPVTLLCDVQDLGNPPVNEYQWKRGEFLITDVRTANWTIEEATLDTQNEYVCLARNSAGEGNPGKLLLDVNAPPAMIGPLLPFHGALETASDVSLICEVECSPRCSIQWLRNDDVLRVADVTTDDNGDDFQGDDDDDDEKNDSTDEWQRLYSVKVSHLPPNLRTGHFSSVVSTLRFNMTNWPGGKLDRTTDVANYTCRSTSNKAGRGVSNTTVFHVEYPPENIMLTTDKFRVNEGDKVPPIGCQADADPVESYVWIYDGNVVSSKSVLSLNFALLRDRSGLYTCTVSNLHGNTSASVFLDVLYEPKCELVSHIEEGVGTVLICTANGNPATMSYEWLLNNATVVDSIYQSGFVSRLTNVKAGGRYTCIANNSVGQSGLCSIEMAGGEGAMIAGFSDNRIIIIIIVVLAVIILAIIMCIVIVMMIRRRKSLGKYSNRMGMEPRENPEGHSQQDNTRRGRPGRKPGVVTFKKVDSDSVGRSQGSQLLADKQGQSEIPLGGIADGDRAFYENLPFHGLQPAPNKNLERPVPAPRDYSPTKMRHIYQNLLLPLRASKPFKPLLSDMEYADVDFPPLEQRDGGPPLRPPRSVGTGGGGGEKAAVSNNNHHA